MLLLILVVVDVVACVVVDVVIYMSCNVNVHGLRDDEYCCH